MTPRRDRRGANQRGSVMIFAIGFMVVLMVIGAGVHSQVLRQLRSSGEARQRVAAEALAEGGLARALAWFTASGYQLPTSALLIASVPATLKSNQKALVLPTNHPDGYTDAVGQTRTGVLSAFNAALSAQQGASGSFDVTASLIAVQPETWEVIATGTAGAVQRRVGRVLMRERQSLFEEALFGEAEVVLTGNTSTDSYDSTLGAYGGSNRFATGGVHSNGNITLTGSSTINGDAKPGPESAVIFKGNPTVTGLKDAADSDRELAPVTIPAGAVALGDVVVKQNDRRTITAGTYVVQNLDVNGSGILTIDSSAGGVTFFVTGWVRIGGAGKVVVTANGPRGFSIMQIGNGGVWVGGSGEMPAAIYAPDSHLTVDGAGDLYGGFIGAGAHLDGSGQVHFDQSLRTATTASGPLRTVAQWTPP